MKEGVREKEQRRGGKNVGRNRERKDRECVYWRKRGEGKGGER